VLNLSKDRILEKTNVAFFTASSDLGMYEEIRQSGVKEILKKPCGIEDLENVIKNMESGQIDEHERMKLVKTILNDNSIKNILVTKKILSSHARKDSLC
jgi:hypothetical protein